MVGGVVAIVDEVSKDVMKQLVDLGKRDCQRVTVCKFSLLQ